MIFYCGKICSGKSTTAKAVSQYLNLPYVEVSSIVRDILNVQNRMDLLGHPELDKLIIDKLRSLDPRTIVSGVRQLSILKAFPDSEFIWIEVCYKDRLRRFVERGDCKDKSSMPIEESFQKADEGDRALGIEDVRSFILERSI